MAIAVLNEISGILGSITGSKLITFQPPDTEKSIELDGNHKPTCFEFHRKISRILTLPAEYRANSFAASLQARKAGKHALKSAYIVPMSKKVNDAGVFSLSVQLRKQM